MLLSVITVSTAALCVSPVLHVVVTSSVVLDIELSLILREPMISFSRRVGVEKKKKSFTKVKTIILLLLFSLDRSQTSSGYQL